MKSPTKQQVRFYLRRSFSQQMEDSRLFAFYCNKTEDELMNILPCVQHDKKRKAIIEGILQYLSLYNSRVEAADVA